MGKYTTLGYKGAKNIKVPDDLTSIFRPEWGLLWKDYWTNDTGLYLHGQYRYL